MASYSLASANTLFRRCVSCPNETPSCPKCPSGQVCSLVPPSCDACQSTQCVASSASPSTISTSTKSSSSGPNVGAIAGGVIGGLVVIAIATYFMWKYCIKNKRQQYVQDEWVEEDRDDSTPAEKDFTMRRDARASTHTVGSIASTVLTRASNIIQIAYIPGVTNRSAPSTPGLLVPPVPPIPIALSSTSGTPRYEQEHFFMPGDLRDSTYSGMTDRTSYARNSVASTIYGKNAVVSPIPAQTVIRGKAAVVSVKSSGGSSPGELTPPVPNVDYGKYGPAGPPSPAFSVGSTFLNNASAATLSRPQVVRVASGPKKNTAPSLHELEDTSTTNLLTRGSNAVTIIDDTPAVEQGPFSDPPLVSRQSSSSLSAVIEQAEKKKNAGSGLKNSITPFGDEHEVKE